MSKVIYIMHLPDNIMKHDLQGFCGSCNCFVFRIKMKIMLMKTSTRKRRTTPSSLEESLSPTGTVMRNQRGKKPMKMFPHRKEQTITSCSVQPVSFYHISTCSESVSYSPTVPLTQLRQETKSRINVGR